MNDEDINRKLTMEEMKAWLISLGISEDDLGNNHVETLIDHGFAKKASLISISKEDLKEVNDSIIDEGTKLPVALRNLLFTNLDRKRKELDGPIRDEGKPPLQLANLIDTSWEMAVQELKALLEPHIDKLEPPSADPAKYCFPQMMKTWNAANMVREVRKYRDLLSPRLMNFKPEDRVKVVIGIRLGTGCGKTHALVEAGKCLASTLPLIYVTYNQNQLLTADRADPRKALLIRLILALTDAASASTGKFLNSAEAHVCFEPEVTLEKLRSLFVSYAAKKSKKFEIAIGVDETKKLGVEEAKAVISELGHVAAKYKQETGNMCTVLVTSLIWETFETDSESSVEIWTPHVPDEDAIKYFSQGIEGYEPKEVAAVLTAVGGCHMRSIVVARRLMKKHKLVPTVNALYKRMKSGLQISFDQKTPRLIQHYIRSCIEKKFDEQKYDTELERYMDSRGAVAPIMIIAAYSSNEGTSGSTVELLPDSLVAEPMQVERAPEHPARSSLLALFDSATLFLDGPKQLEEVAKAYDFFRQKLSLPVVPANASIGFPNDEDGAFQSEEWYRKLVFPTEMEEDKRSLLKQEKVGSPAKKSKRRKTTKSQAPSEKTVFTGVKITLGNYFHPEQSNHPWLDRAFLARQPSSARRCLVLAQDKVNEDDFSKAVKLLNQAAALLSKETGVKDVLCIANVIGAGSRTGAQSSFEFPYILVRNDEVSQFFSINFAVPVLFARERHLLQYEKKTNGMLSGGSV